MIFFLLKAILDSYCWKFLIFENLYFAILFKFPLKFDSPSLLSFLCEKIDKPDLVSILIFRLGFKD